MTKHITRIALALVVAQVLVIFTSWLVSATLPQNVVHSLLSSEGIRWFFGRFTDNMQTPVLVWLLLASLAVAVARSCGFTLRTQTYRQRFALQLVVLLVLVIVIVMGLLTLVPRAILLSSSGELFPSSASACLIPVLCGSVFAASVLYGLASGRFSSFRDVTKSLQTEATHVLPLVLLYVLSAQLIASLLFVFNWE
ncbi:MAG: AbgT family transporter [Prevotella sp.]|nr:AbgT family transporter [Prevotella sp.]